MFAHNFHTTVPHFLMCHKVQGTEHFITLTQTLNSEKMIGTPYFGCHVVRWTPYFGGTSRTLNLEIDILYILHLDDTI